MSRPALLIFSGLLLFSFSTHAASPNSLTQSFDFGDITKEKPWAGEWLRVPGHPEVPTVYARIALPYGKKIKSVTFTPKERGERREPVETKIVPAPQTACESHWTYDEPLREYVADEAFPASFVGEASEQRWLGYRLATIPLYVRKYYPASKEGTTISGGELKVELADDDTPELLRAQRKDRELVATTVTNPDTLGTYPMPLGARAIEYLAIAPKSFIEDEEPYNLKALLAEKESRAIPTKMVSLESIQADFLGRDLQEKVRNAIVDHYKKDGVRYVLLVGNGHSIFPSRLLTVSAREVSLPSDLYFACLDGDFDGNGNGKFGEPKDGLGGKDVDLACEVAVGRAPVTTKDDMHAFVKKTLTMQRVAFFDARIWNTLSFGEKLDAQTLGSKAIEPLERTGLAGQSATQGYPAKAKFTKLHETFSKTYSASDVVQALKSGDFYTVNHLGRADDNSGMRFSSSRINEITNEFPFFGITQGCLSGNLRKPNWASQLVTSSVGGAAAMIANSHYGFYTPGGSGGPSNQFHLAFYDTIFHDGARNLGLIHYRTKVKLIPSVQSANVMRWVVYQTNLLGDPELELRF